MLTIYGGRNRFCDGVSRRSFLKIGGFTMGAAAFGLSDLLSAEAATGKKQPHKAVINIFLAGGPPHQDTFDLKMDAPSDIRGEFKPIPTNVDGIQICEVFPQLAKVTDRLAIVRSIVGSAPDHDAYQCMTGWPRRAMENAGGYPGIGSVVTKLQGWADPVIPAAVGLAAPTVERRWSDSGSPGFLGAKYAPFKPFMTGAQGRPDSGALVGAYENGPGLKLQGLTLERLRDRKRLLQGVDQMRRDLDANDQVQALDAGMQAAFDILTSSKLADALDLSKENPKLVERYGDGKPYKYQYDGSPTCNDHLLMARRLVEAGVRCVTLSYGRWDSHGQNFDLVRDHGPKLDQCLSALIEDLDDRGMLDDVTVVAWGEFGRTPKINNDAGRDHWPDANCAVLAGGGMKVGQVIGSTDRLGEKPDDRPIHMQEIVATIYHNLGIDPRSTQIYDRSARPQWLLEQQEPIQELVG
ncbi:MAG: DUF1501 domain-containing protein [Armatimonadota bacterium]